MDWILPAEATFRAWVIPAECGGKGARLAMMVDHLVASGGPYWLWRGAVRCLFACQAGIAKLWRFAFLPKRAASGSLSSQT